MRAKEQGSGSDTVTCDTDDNQGLNVKAMSDRVKHAYEACVVASTCVGGRANQFPGREKLFAAIQKKRARGDKAFGSEVAKQTDVGNTEYWYGPWRSAVAFMKKEGLIRTIPNSGTYVADHIGSLSDLIDVLKSRMGAQPSLPAPTSPQSRPKRAASISLSATTIEEQSDLSLDSHSKEDITAAEILKDLRLHTKQAVKKTNAAKASALKSKRAASTSALQPSVIPFEIDGPWKPEDAEEEAAFEAMLHALVEENRNVTHWTHVRLKKSSSAIFAVLHAAPYGLPRIDLRNYARKFVGDTGLLDYTIKVLVNRTVCGFFMKRETDPETGRLLYYLEFLDGEREKRHRNRAHAHKAAKNVVKDNEDAKGGAPAPQRKKRSVQSLTVSPEDKQNQRPRRAKKSKVAKVEEVTHLKHRIPPMKTSIEGDLPTTQQIAPTEACMPAKLEESWLRMQQRVNAAQGRRTTGIQHQSCKQEVNAFVMETIQQNNSKSATKQMLYNTVAGCLHSEIAREMSGVFKDFKDLRKQFNEVK